MKQLKIITRQPKTLKNPNIIDIKLVIIEHPKSCHKLSKTIRQAKKVSQAGACKKSNSLSNSETKKSRKFFDKKMQK